MKTTKKEEPAFTGATIDQARAFMRPLLKDGVTCPCCLQNAQIYHRPLTSAMILGLIILSNAQGDDNGFIHVENYLKGVKDIPASTRGDVPKLRFWGFLEPKQERKEDGNVVGMYRVTDLGRKFIEGRLLIQKKVKIYNNSFYGFDGPEVDVFTAIKNKFNYNEVINNGKEKIKEAC